jgi:hypothetical protein
MPLVPEPVGSVHVTDAMLVVLLSDRIMPLGEPISTRTTNTNRARVLRKQSTSDANMDANAIVYVKSPLHK